MATEFPKEFICIDCRANTFEINEYYMVRKHLWLKAVPNNRRRMLCIGCIEKRLGRKLTPKDFIDAPINNPRFDPKSQRLMERLFPEMIGY